MRHLKAAKDLSPENSLLEFRQLLEMGEEPMLGAAGALESYVSYRKYCGQWGPY